jgi:L-alanine-DL-glutamate epimerase-like enolase superfamily enzyme
MTRPSFTYRPLDLPLSEPFRIAYDTITHAGNALAEAAQDGLRGYGEAAPVPTITHEDQAKALAGLDRLAGWAPRSLDGWPDDDAGLAASLAYETCMLDLAARAAEEPLCTHLTGARPRAVATSITVPLVDGAALRTRVDWCLAQGFSAFKVKAGGGLDADLARIRYVRERVGGAEVRVDANQGWTREDARAALPVLGDLGVAVLEQPLAKRDLAGHAALTAASDVPIMLDESVFSVDDARRAVAADACHRINIKIQKTGSLRAALAIADVAAEAGMPCMIGCMIESRIGILAAAHVAAAHDNVRWADLDGYTFLRDDPVVGGPHIEAGVLALTDAAGLGVDDVVSASSG